MVDFCVTLHFSSRWRSRVESHFSNVASRDLGLLTNPSGLRFFYHFINFELVNLRMSGSR
jgi:hypothetical protein